MSTSKISLASNPVGPIGPAGWFARTMTGLGVLAVIVAGIAISPAATNAGHEWTHADSGRAGHAASHADHPRRSPADVATSTPERRGVRPAAEAVVRPATWPPFERIAHPLPPVDQAESLRVEPVAAHDSTSRPGFARRVVGSLLQHAKSGLERLSARVVVRTAAR